MILHKRVQIFAIQNLALNNDYEAFWNKVYSYADQNIKR